jgi:hypothetical protein
MFILCQKARILKYLGAKIVKRLKVLFFHPFVFDSQIQKLLKKR